MDRFHRSKRDPASDTQLVFLISLFVAVVVICGVIIHHTVVSGHASSTGSAPGTGPTSLTGSPSIADLLDPSLVVGGLVGVLLVVGIIVQGMALARGRCHDFIEIDQEMIR